MALVGWGLLAWLVCLWLQPVDFGLWRSHSIIYSLYAVIERRFPANSGRSSESIIRLLPSWGTGCIVLFVVAAWIGWMRRHQKSVRAKHLRLPGYIILTGTIIFILSTFALMKIAGESSLYFASGKGFIERSRFLLWLGADPYVPGGSDAPFCKAIYEGHEEIALLFLKNRPPSVQEASEMLLGAAWGSPDLSDSYTRAMEALLEYGADPNYIKVGLKPFLITSGRGNIEVMQLLLENGAIAGASDSNGQTALHYAARNWNGESIQFLFEQGLDINAKDINGLTPLDVAINERNHRLRVQNIGNVQMLRTEINDASETIQLLKAHGAVTGIATPAHSR